MKNLLIASFLFLGCICLKAQDTIIVYNTYDNFLNNTGEFYTECRSLSYSGKGKVKMKLKNKLTRKTRKVSSSEIWGFSYNREFFRSFPEPSQFARLLNNGTVCYWENGLGNLRALWNGSNSADYSIGYKNFISKTIDSPLIALPGSWAPFQSLKAKYETFKSENPQYNKLFNLIGENFEPYGVRNAVKEFEEKQKAAK